ncbi:MAG TPA: substrate-binding domain-containing protein [Clostridia bacterium]|nr:substrate-binding domain-containing protein [Clostridia bacterium]
MEKRVDGLLLASIHPTAEAGRMALDAGFPLVAMDQALPISCIQVGFPFSSAAVLATEHLIACGHRRIGFLGAPLDRPSRRQMLGGFQGCLRDHGLPLPESWIQLASAESEQAGNYEFATGAAGALAFLAMDERPTAYLCLNDMTAFGAMKTFREAGLILPRDASIVGCDNLAFGAVSSPALTTLDQHAYEMGNLASRLLIEQIEQPGCVQSSVQLEPTLIVRDSVHCLSAEYDFQV